MIVIVSKLSPIFTRFLFSNYEHYFACGREDRQGLYKRGG